MASGSLALLANAAHAGTDAAGLVIALVAATFALRPATARRTWGYRRAEVLGATVQAAVLLIHLHLRSPAPWTTARGPRTPPTSTLGPVAGPT